MSYLIQSARTFVNGILTDHAASPLEIQMAKQLKEQSLQMEEMKQLMEGMKTLLVKMEAETALRAKREAEAKRKAEAEHRAAKLNVERRADAKRKAEARADELKPNPWTCPADGRVYPWTYKGVKYLRNSENHVFMYAGKECGDWKGVYLMEEDRIDESVISPYED
jgi:hypothetical protein